VERGQRNPKWVPVEHVDTLLRVLGPVKPFSDEWFLYRFLSRWKPEHIIVAAKKRVDLASLFM